MRADIAKKWTGAFLVFDGPDGAGKSSQSERVRVAFEDLGVEVVRCHDPGTTEIGERIRSLILGHDLSGMDPNCETMLFMAARAQLVSEIIRPAIQSGKTVICDRFVSSTCAYQGAAGYDPQRVIELAQYAIDDLWPSLTIILDISPEEGFARIKRTPKHAGKNFSKKNELGNQHTLWKDTAPDSMEARSMKFHRSVRERFRSLGEIFPAPVEVIDASGDADQVARGVVECLDRVTF